MRIERRHLPALLNRLYDRGDDRFTVSHPADAVDDLFTIELADPEDCTVRFSKRRNAYASARDEVRRRHREDVARDLPEPDEYLKAVVASGIVPIRNEGEIQKTLTQYGDPDLMAGHPPVFAGVDTNLLPWRLDRILGLRDPKAGLGYVNGFVLATGVRDELTWDVKCDDTDPYVEAFGPAFEEYWNQPVGSARISRLGLAAYRDVRDIGQATEIECDRGDEAIVAAYDEWQDESRGRVLLFSNDRNFVERARGHTLLAQRVELPRDLPRTAPASWREVAVLLYLLATLFGVVSLPGVTVHGVWRGKGGADWQRERLKLDVRSTTLEPRLERDLAIAEEFSKRSRE